MGSGARTVPERARWRARLVGIGAAALVMMASSAAVAGSAWTLSWLRSARPYYRLDPSLDPDAPARTSSSG